MLQAQNQTERISIHALREEGDIRGPAGHDDHLPISIHALREEGDLAAFRLPAQTSYFYPRPPRGGRQPALLSLCVPIAFLSTPSARRATQRFQRHDQRRVISIHALREEGDSRSSFRSRPAAYFYPRPPRGGRPIGVPGASMFKPISIHALREEGDFPGSVSPVSPILFLSTPSARRATIDREAVVPVLMISIHALREEGDR